VNVAEINRKNPLCDAYDFVLGSSPKGSPITFSYIAHLQTSTDGILRMDVVRSLLKVTLYVHYRPFQISVPPSSDVTVNRSCSRAYAR
jgi:hypothetical protein